MNLLQRILDRACVLAVTFSDAENYTMRLMGCRYRKGGAECMDAADVAALGDIRKELTAFPVIVMLSGYGVITKEKGAAAGVMDKIKEKESGFLWSEYDDAVSFIREQQLVKLYQALDEVKAKVVSKACIPHEKGAPEEQLKQAATNAVGKYYSRELKFASVLKPTVQGSFLAQLTAAKIKLPVLGLVMLALTVNMLSASKVQGRYQNVRMELEAVRKTVGQTDEASRRQQELVREYISKLPYKASFMCDRIAVVLPEKIILTSLSVQPSMRAIENNKKTLFAEDRIVITGESPTSESISEFLSALGREEFASRVELSSLGQGKEAFDFKIIVDL